MTATATIVKAMRLGNNSFKVIGTLKEKRQSILGDDQDDLVIIPLRTLQRRMIGTSDVETILVDRRTVCFQAGHRDGSVYFLGCGGCRLRVFLGQKSSPPGSHRGITV